MRLLLDENLAARLARDLADLFPGSTHVIPLGLGGARDRAIWDHAAAEEFTIVTRDEDFLRLSVLLGPPPKVRVMKTDASLYRLAVRPVIVAAAILTLPLLAMRVTDQVNWDLTDFVIMGALLVGTGLTYEMVTRKTGDIAYRAAVCVALAAAFLLVWMNGAVGIIGEDNPANVVYVGALAVGVTGAVMALGRPHGTARALLATALAQAMVAAIVLMDALASGALDIVVLNGLFVALFVGSALMFRHATRRPAPVQDQTASAS